MTKSHKTYHVKLDAHQRQYLWQLIEGNQLNAAEQKRAYGLLYADEPPQGPGLPDADIAEMLGLHRMTIVGLRYRFAQTGLECTLGITTATKTRLERRREASQLAQAGWQLIGEAAKTAGYSPKYVHRLVRVGLLSKVKRVRGKLYISATELAAYRATTARNGDRRKSYRQTN